MQRRTLIRYIATYPGALIATPLVTGLSSVPVLASERGPDASFDLPEFTSLDKSDEEWSKLLPENKFRILFKEATERAFTSPLDKEKRDGVFICAACYLPLFLSEDKFDSGTGWPSFTRPIAGTMGKKTDFKLILPRTEYHCIRCTGHQGHVFKDGPAPTGERWCNNGLALEFFPEGHPLPKLRS